MKECTFTPKIDKRSSELAANVRYDLSDDDFETLTNESKKYLSEVHIYSKSYRVAIG